MNPFIGTFVVGDNVSQARIAITDGAGVPWGTAVATGYLVEMEVRKPGSQTVVTTLTGSWEDGTEGAGLFTIGDVALLEPDTGVETQDYEGIVVLTKGGAVAKLGAGDSSAGVTPFQFKVRAWP